MDEDKLMYIVARYATHRHGCRIDPDGGACSCGWSKLRGEFYGGIESKPTIPLEEPMIDFDAKTGRWNICVPLKSAHSTDWCSVGSHASHAEANEALGFLELYIRRAVRFESQD